ncbi:hypothetical protein BDF14DRAFT_1884035 [Spinellus fusiger]|nr:hypothetical protein BDF14DRAFT_1884035 [Spinellus fusiger]
MTVTPLPYEIAHCSSWDEEYSPQELVSSSPGNRQLNHLGRSDEEDEAPTNNKIKGWQTPKCPEYPQDLIIHLLCGPAHISKVQVLSHHYKIATKIDVYVGVLKDAPDDMNDTLSRENDTSEGDMLIEFTRLGYVCLDNNARAQFKARELKSIKVNVDGEYIRLVVGLLALNILGQPLRQMPVLPNHIACHISHPLDESSMLSSSTRRTSVSSNHSFIHRSSSSGSVEVELQQWISALLHAEEEAVRDEAYQTAKSHKFLSDKLSRLAKILLDLEIGKKHAVDTKDYDEAEKIKADIKEIRISADTMLKQAMIQMTQDGRVIPLESTDGYGYEEDIGQEDILPASYLSSIPNTPNDTHPTGESMTLVNYEPHEDRNAREDRLFDEAIEKWTSFDILSTPTTQDDRQLGDILTHSPVQTPSSPSYPSFDKRALFAPEASLSSSVAVKHLARRESTIITKGCKPSQDFIDPDSVPETLIEEERESCKAAIQVFGEEVVACVLSVKVKCRERGLNRVATSIKAACHLAQEEQLDQLCQLIYQNAESALDDQEQEYDEYMRESVRFVKASLTMIQEAVMDSRESILNMAITIWQDLNDFCMDALVPPSMVYGLIERAFSGLLMRTGDSNPRIRLPATRLVLTLAEKYSDPPYSLLCLFIGKPERIIHNYKEARARIELVTAAVHELGILVDYEEETSQAIILLSDLMEFVVAYMGHSNEDVRETAVELIIVASDQVGFPHVSKYIGKDLRATLADTVKKLADPRHGSGTTAVSAAIIVEESTKPMSKNAATVAELRALAAQPNPPATKKSKAPDTRSSARRPDSIKRSATVEKKESSRDTGTGTGRSTTSLGTTTGAKKTNGRATSRTTTSRGTTAGKSTKTQEEPSNENSADFNEDTLISHYYNACPVLTNCPMCHIILEVSTYNDHIFIDCDQRHLMKQCNQCRQAVPVEQWLQHTLKKTCVVSGADDVRCPLCQLLIIPPTEAGWKSHLLTGEGCLKSARGRRVKKEPVKKSTLTESKTATSKREPTSNGTKLPKSETGSLRRKK